MPDAPLERTRRAYEMSPDLSARGLIEICDRLRPLQGPGGEYPQFVVREAHVIEAEHHSDDWAV